jgi:uncharacterized membrane protein
MGGMAIGWILGAALIGASVWLLFHLGGDSSASHESPEETLKGRYARGEVDRNTFETMLRDLKS